MSTPEWVNVKDHGALGNGRSVNDGQMGPGSPTLTSATASFAPADVNKRILVSRAGAGGADLLGSIQAVVNPTTVTLDRNAQTTVRLAFVSWGTDDTAAIQTAINSLQFSGQDVRFMPPEGAFISSRPPVYFPAGHYILTNQLSVDGVTSLISDFGAILHQHDPARKILVIDHYRNVLAGLKFLGGSQQISLANANVDVATVEIHGCEFQLSSDYAIHTRSTLARSAGDGAMSSGSSLLTCASAPFSAGDVGKSITITGAGPARSLLATTIAGFLDPTRVTLALNAQSTVTNAAVGWGDNLSTNLSVRKCVFVAARRGLYNVCDSALVEDCWIHPKAHNFDDDTAVFYNRSGRLFLRNCFGVPAIGSPAAADGSMRPGSAVLTCASSAPFVPADVGKAITVRGAGPAGGRLETTILSYQLPTQVTLRANASTDVNGAYVSWVNKTAPDGAITAGTAVLRCATSRPFSDSDVGRAITVMGAGAAGANLSTVITSVRSAAEVTLAASAGTTRTATAVLWAAAQRPRFVRWIDQFATGPVGHGSPGGVWALNCRFGSEDGGMPIVYSFAGPNNAYPFVGSVISITASQLSAGLAALQDSAVIYVKANVPQSIHVQDNFYPVGVPYLKNDGTITSLAAYFVGTHPSVAWKVVLEPNLAPGAASVPPEILAYTRLLDSFEMFSAPPTSGAWVTGQRVWNRAPTLGGHVGWVCLAGGTPGTWAEFGPIQDSIAPLTLVTGVNENIVLGPGNYYRIVGPLENFELTSIAGGADSRQVTFLNTTVFTMTVRHDAGAAPLNRIECRNGVNIDLPGQWGSVTLRYCRVDGVNFRWHVVAAV